MTVVAELRELDDTFQTQPLARFLVRPDNSIDVLELGPLGAALAADMLTEPLMDPFGRTVTSTDGADYLKTLRWARSTDFRWVTPIVDVPDRDARNPATTLRTPTERHVPATVPYPDPPAALTGVRVAEIRWPRPEDYTRTEVVARLVDTGDQRVRVEGSDAAAVTDTQRLLAGMGDPRLDQLVDRNLAPGMVVLETDFGEPGDRAWRNALVGARSAALSTGQQDAVVRLDQEFLTRLPRVWLSRCPFTGDVLRMAVDAWDLDGPFWDPAHPLRPLDDELPGTFLGLAGTVRDTSTRPVTVPLYPELADRPEVRAVLSASWVGDRRCDLVAYYARPGSPDMTPIREWGTRMVRVRNGGRHRWVAAPAAGPQTAADVRPWLRSGRLAWIRPGDSGVELCSGPDGCPWLETDPPAQP